MNTLSQKYAFISYSSREKEVADELRALLHNSGIRSWMAPNDIPYGSKYAQVINRAIKECDCFLLILSNNAQDSVWVAKEVERAINYRKTIIPVQIESLILNDEFELYISTDQIVSIDRVDASREEVKQLVAIVAKLTGAQGVKKQPRTILPSPESAIRNAVRPNDPCPCGSGKKYKNCHGAANQSADTYHVGDKVKSDSFGIGIVRSCTPVGDDTILEIFFYNVGTKKVAAKYAKLAII